MGFYGAMAPNPRLAKWAFLLLFLAFGLGPLILGGPLGFGIRIPTLILAAAVVAFLLWAVYRGPVGGLGG